MWKRQVPERQSRKIGQNDQPPGYLSRPISRRDGIRSSVPVQFDFYPRGVHHLATSIDFCPHGVDRTRLVQFSSSVQLRSLSQSSEISLILALGVLVPVWSITAILNHLLQILPKGSRIISGSSSSIPLTQSILPPGWTESTGKSAIIWRKRSRAMAVLTRTWGALRRETRRHVATAISRWIPQSTHSSSAQNGVWQGRPSVR